MFFDPVLTGLVVFSIITLYWSILGTYVLFKSGVISSKFAPILVAYSFLAWLTSRIMYMNFPEVPPHPILIISGLVESPISILTTVYVYYKTKIIKLKWIPYIALYSLFLAANRISLYLCRNLPVPDILLLPRVLSEWASLPAWFFIYVKSNRIFSIKQASIVICYQALVWFSLIFMLYYLALPYSQISALEVVMNYPITLLTLIFIDRYRLSRLEHSSQ